MGYIVDKMKERIRNCLTAMKPRQLTNGFAREAAVLMPVFEWEDEFHFLLTRRTEEVQTHKGQISFPGGMRENGEELVQTALRETYEEVGIDESRIEILGRFHDYVSIHNFRVVPFAGFIKSPFKTIPQAQEVAEVLHVPIRIFLDPSLLRIEKSERPFETEVYYYSFGTHQIWGLTAHIIKDFIEAIRLKPGKGF
jgi:8-oxo-dGTP pyrophosphatase MutT (NUDIX family)